METKQAIMSGKTSLGIELGSTRIKAVLIGEDFSPIAQGGYDWENRFENGVWTYKLDEVWAGLAACYKNLTDEVNKKFGIPLSRIGSIGISAMMHGYLVFDKSGGQLAQFRTWRNTSTGEAASKLSELFNFNIPQRWSIAHLYQAALNGESHVADVAFMTTLAGFVHWQLTGEKVLGLDDASGMFPIENGAYNARLLDLFDGLAGGYSWKARELLPKPLAAGQNAGFLTQAGAKLLDPSGVLQAGIPLCPPEGDAGTGMVATNSVSQRTGNVSAGTSIFAMIVLEKALSRMYPEIDMVVTPCGKPAAMIHCNNCSGDIDAWVKLFSQAIALAGGKIDTDDLYGALYNKALEGDKDCGGLLAYNYYSGEHNTGFEEGRPLFARLPDSSFTLANFMRCLLFSAFGSLKIGMDILTENEHIALERLLGHGGIFKTKGVAQSLMAAALDAPVSVMDSAGEGGAWGIALLAAFLRQGGGGEKSPEFSLEKFLAEKVFAGAAGEKITPDAKDVSGFREFMKRYTAGLKIESAAVEHLRA